jgi:hypothetical protein
MNDEEKEQLLQAARSNKAQGMYNEEGQVAQRVENCYLPRCTHIGTIEARIEQGVYWPSDRLIGSLRTRIVLCDRHVEQLAREGVINA